MGDISKYTKAKALQPGAEAPMLGSTYFPLLGLDSLLPASGSKRLNSPQKADTHSLSQARNRRISLYFPV
jgi:hypothetical protein